MTMAKTEGLISNESLGVHGFIFSPDFDTSQSMDISAFLKSVNEKTCRIYRSEINYEGFKLPTYVMGDIKNRIAGESLQSDEVCERIVKNTEKYSLGHINWSKERSLNVEDLTDERFGRHFVQITLDNGTEYLVKEKEFFLCEVPFSGVIVLVLNPFLAIFKREELKQKEGYRENCGMYLKKSSKKTYLAELRNRQNEIFEEIKTTFDKFYTKAQTNGLVSGSFNMFLTNGYAILAGTKQDSINCLNRGVFPYKVVEEHTLVRRTEEEIVQIIKEEEEYKRKSDIVAKRIDKLEEKLKEKGYSWTVISKYKISFKEDESGKEYWSTWMNAQVHDGAHFGWFTEQDFIDWINMEGKIPFHRSQVSFFARLLEELTKDNPTKEQYVVQDVVPLEKKKDMSYYDDYKSKAVIKVGSKKQDFTLEEIKKLVKKYSREEMKSYTKEDFEKELKSKGIISKIKSLIG